MGLLFFDFGDNNNIEPEIENNCSWLLRLFIQKGKRSAASYNYLSSQESVQNSS